MRFREIGGKIKQAREESGLTQLELAARLKCTQSALSNYELGKRKLNLTLLIEIAQMLNKPIDFFTESTAEDKNQESAGLRLPRL
ncbi:MAG: helix-turn-helix transcriptional regulator [Dehalococcoidia bacterium]